MDTQGCIPIAMGVIVLARVRSLWKLPDHQPYFNCILLC